MFNWLQPNRCTTAWSPRSPRHLGCETRKKTMLLKSKASQKLHLRLSGCYVEQLSWTLFWKTVHNLLSQNTEDKIKLALRLWQFIHTIITVQLCSYFCYTALQPPILSNFLKMGPGRLHCHETSKEEIIPATVFLTGSACMLLGDCDGCSSWQTLQLYPLSHLRKARQPLPSGTGSSCTGCCNKDTEAAGRNCCSRPSPQPAQTCSPRALCWGGKGCPEWASVPLEKKKKHHYLSHSNELLLLPKAGQSVI